MNLMILHEADFTAPDTVTISGTRFEHVRKVLRAGQGDCVKVGLLNGKMGLGVIIEHDNTSATLKASLTEDPPEASSVTLVCALQRPQTMKKVIQAAVAFGVKNFHFINTRKVEKSYWSSPLLEEEALNRHVILGLEQGCDTVMPQINFHRGFKGFAENKLRAIIGDSLGLVAHPGDSKTCPSQVDRAVTLCIGPEGGFNEFEIENFVKYGCELVHLGSRPLRTEFAVCALLGRIL